MNMPSASQTDLKLTSDIIPLRRRSDFLRVQKSPLRWVTPAFVVSCEPCPDDMKHQATQIGFTITKKIGNAVMRNRIRRRFRHMTRQVLPTLPALHGWTIIMLARPEALTRDFAAIDRDLRWALRKLQAQLPNVASHASA